MKVVLLLRELERDFKNEFISVFSNPEPQSRQIGAVTIPKQEIKDGYRQGELFNVNKPVSEAEKVAEKIFYAETFRGKERRSITPGDILLFKSESSVQGLVCCSVGWAQLSVTEVKQ